MFTVYDDAHALHNPQVEMADGKLIPAVEIPHRVERVRKALLDAKLVQIVPPEALDRDLIARVHDADYIAFLESFWQRWLETGRDPEVRDAFPFVWPAAGLRRLTPRHLDGLMGRYSFDAGTPMGPGTWTAALSSARVSQTAAFMVARGSASAFGLCRPPGHHAMPDAYGGYCFLNNAAIAAEALLTNGAKQVAVLDVDYHHGNGTQTVFYDRSDVLFVSVHADPNDEYPYFLGHADEIGIGAGEGFNVNLPLPLGTDWPEYRDALATAMQRIVDFGADALVVSLGLDTYENDPISHFCLATDDFAPFGRAIAKANLPTVFVFEGGYAVDQLGLNAIQFLSGFLDAHAVR